MLLKWQDRGNNNSNDRNNAYTITTLHRKRGFERATMMAQLAASSEAAKTDAGG